MTMPTPDTQQEAGHESDLCSWKAAWRPLMVANVASVPHFRSSALLWHPVLSFLANRDSKPCFRVWIQIALNPSAPDVSL